jgi:glycosyltransferase involved in cell wall biosynthesis
MKANQPTLLAQANQAFRERDYIGSLQKYNKAIKENPGLLNILTLNIELTKARIHKTSLNSCATREAISARKTRSTQNQVDNNITLSATDLIPLADIESTGNQGTWLATSCDPSFQIMNSNNSLVGPGFFRLEVKLEFDKRKEVSRIYINGPKGYTESNAFYLTLKNNIAASRLLYLREQTIGLRFDPIESPGEFTINTFSVESLDEETAIAEIKAELKSRNINIEPVHRESSDLFKLYDNSYRSSLGTLDYQDWIRFVEEPSIPTAKELQNIHKMTIRPLFSVILPVYNTDEHYLRECIDSILSQSYSKLELCIADDNSSRQHIAEVLYEYEQKDKRVKVVKRKENGHISAASNSAIGVATGDFIVLVDHDDTIPEYTLSLFAEAINCNPDAKILYSDEDKIDANGNRSNPHFKSDWNPDLFYSQNYVSHLGVYKADIIKKIGGFRIGVEGSQDQDLLLRCLQYAKHNEVIHIPKVLYHWRMIEGSTALDSSQKSYTTEAGIKALTDYFVEHGPSGITVEKGLLDNTYKINWPIPKQEPLVSLLIPTRDKVEVTKLAVDSILDKTTYQNYEIIIIDNGSTEEKTLSWFKSIQEDDERIRVIPYDHPFNYSAINNYGVRFANGSVIGLINNDIEVINQEWLTEMVRHALRPSIGCVGAKLYYGNDTVQHGGVILSLGGVAGHSHKHFNKNSTGYFYRLALTQNLSAVTAAALLVKKEIYEEVNGLNEQDLQVAFNDVDFCLKVREAGYLNIWTPYAELYHHESLSRGHDDTPEKKERFAKELNYMKQRWGRALAQDPYYNPNLTKLREDFSIGIDD